MTDPYRPVAELNLLDADDEANGCRLSIYLQACGNLVVYHHSLDMCRTEGNIILSPDQVNRLRAMVLAATTPLEALPL